MNDFDPTTNRIPFGLLSEDEQTTLIHWPHGWEFYHWEDKWDTLKAPSWTTTVVYRGKPAPVVTSVWFSVYPKGPSRADDSTREEADLWANKDRIAVLRIDTCNGVSTAHLEQLVATKEEV